MSLKDDIEALRAIPTALMIPQAIKDLERLCPPEWVDVRERLREAYEACPK